MSTTSPGSRDEKKTPSVPVRAAGFEASLSLLRDPRAPPLKRCSQLCHGEVEGCSLGPPALCSHVSLPTGPSRTFPWEPVPGLPRLVQERPVSKQNVPGCPQPCQGSASSPSRAVHPSCCWVPRTGVASSLVTSECTHWWQVREGLLLCPLDATQGPNCFPSLIPQPQPKKPETGDDLALLSKRGVCIFPGMQL